MKSAAKLARADGRSLEQAWEKREGNLIYLKHLALLIPGLADDPRVAGLLRRIGLPE